MDNSILDKLPVALFITDKKGKINFFNAFAEKITGLSVAEAIGMNCQDILNETACDPVCPFSKINRTRKGVYNRECEITRKDGNTVSMICDCSLLEDQEGNSTAAVGVFRDISFQKKLEKSLRESERKLSTLMSNLPGMAYRCLNDEHWTMEFISEGCLELTGHRASELIGNRKLSYNQLIHQDDRERVWDQIQKAVRKTRSFQFIYRIQTASGDEKWVWEQGRGVFSGDGHLLVLEGFITDISLQMRLEHKLKVSERKYRRIYEGTKDMIFIVSKDGTIREMNQAGVEMLKYNSRKELLALESVEHIFFNVMHWKVFKTQIDRQGFVKDFEAIFKKKDGTRIHCLLTGNRIGDANEAVDGYEGIAKDITPRVDAVRKLEQQHRELKLLTTVALAINKNQDLDDVFMVALKEVLKALNLASGGIFLIDKEQSSFLLKAQEGLAENPLNSNCTVFLHDKKLMNSLLARKISLKPEPAFPPFKAVFQDAGSTVSTELLCFLITAKSKASGFIGFVVPSDKDINSERKIHLLGSLCNFLGGAIENARLLETIQVDREELKELTALLLHAQEKERKRIARELHDEAGQIFAGLGFTLEAIENSLSCDQSGVKELTSDIKRKIKTAYQELRRISYSLHPATLSDLGLEPALSSYLTEVSRRSKLSIDFKMIGFDKRMEPEVETLLYRLSQEALTNALKHSNAKHFRLSIVKSFPHIIFFVEDDGVGFEFGKLKQRGQALGLLGMRERASMLGGSFTIKSSKGKGTRIRIKIPVNETWQ